MPHDDDREQERAQQIHRDNISTMQSLRSEIRSLMDGVITEYYDSRMDSFDELASVRNRMLERLDTVQNVIDRAKRNLRA